MSNFCDIDLECKESLGPHDTSSVDDSLTSMCDAILEDWLTSMEPDSATTEIMLEILHSCRSAFLHVRRSSPTSVAEDCMHGDSVPKLDSDLTVGCFSDFYGTYEP